MFNNMSIKARLWLQAIFQLGIMIFVGGISVYYISILSGELKQISLSNMPTIRAMTIADMYHEGTMSLSYRTVYYAETNDDERLQEAKKDLADLKADFLKQFDDIEHLDFHADVVNKMKVVRADVEVYIKIAEDIWDLSDRRKLNLVGSRLSDLDRQFKKLESEFEEAASFVMRHSNEETEKALGDASHAITGTFAAGVVGIILGLLVAFLAIRLINTTLERAIGMLSSESAKLNLSSSEIRAESQKLSQATTEQAAAIEETVASSEEMASMLSQTSQQANRSLQVAEEGKVESERGLKVVGRMGLAMDDIQQANEKLERLVRLIEDIKSKTKIINDIVSETRLLSFNASIEAARAGTHGKGFAVVAEEVGKLATMSGKAADEIRTLLESSTSEVSQIVRSTQEKVSVGKSVATECETAFNEMGTTLSRINESVTKIASASKEQEIGIKQTNRAMAEMDIVTNNNSQSAEKLSAEANALYQATKGLEATTKTIEHLVYGNFGGIVPSPKGRLDSAAVPVKDAAKAPLKAEKTMTMGSGATVAPSGVAVTPIQTESAPKIENTNLDINEPSRKGFKWKKSA